MKASIVIINYNDKLRVGRAIESALNQTWQNKEVILVDDGSTQDVRDLYKAYIDRITYVQLEKDDKSSRTPSRARNKGLDIATGDYICFLDSDNYYHSDFLEKCITTGADVAYVNWEIVGLEQLDCKIERVWKEGAGLLNNYISFSYLDHQCLLIKRDYLGNERYDERLPRSQDCDLIVRLILKGGKWTHVLDKLFTFEKHENDQMKRVASIYGKTMWSLKNNINITWLLQVVSQSPHLLLAYHRAIYDFVHSEIWREDYEKSEFRNLYEENGKILNIEQTEKVSAEV